MSGRVPRYVAATALSFLLAATAGCAGPAPRGGAGGGGNAGRNLQGAGVGGINAGFVGNDRGRLGGAAQANLGEQISAFVAGLDGVGGRGAGGGGAMGGAGAGAAGGAGAGGAAAGGPMRWAGGGGATGLFGGRPVGVSTLIVDDIAFIGIDATATGAPGAGGVTPGGTMGMTTGGAAAGGGPVGTGMSMASNRMSTGTGDTTGTRTGTDGVTAGSSTGLTGAGTTAGGYTVTGATGMQDTVRAQVRDAFPQITEVFVTTDPVQVYRIARVTGAADTATTLSGRISEIMSIALAMAPTAGTTGAGGVGR